MKYDKIRTGLLVGIAVPLVIFTSIYLFRYDRVPFSDYLAHLWRLKVTFKILSLSGFANLLVFFYYYRHKMDRAARGIILASFIYAFLFLIFEVIKF